MNRGKYCFSLFLFFLILLINLSPVYAKEEKDLPVIEHTPIPSFNSGEMIEIRAVVPGEIEWMRFFFRCGVEEFQVRNMSMAEDGAHVFEFDTSILSMVEFEYYLEAKRGDQTIRRPSGAPTEPITVVGQSEKPLPEIPEEFPSPKEEDKKFRLPLSINGSIETKLAQKESLQMRKKHMLTGT